MGGDVSQETQFCVSRRSSSLLHRHRSVLHSLKSEIHLHCKMIQLEQCLLSFCVYGLCVFVFYIMVIFWGLTLVCLLGIIQSVLFSEPLLLPMALSLYIRWYGTPIGHINSIAPETELRLFCLNRVDLSTDRLERSTRPYPQRRSRWRRRLTPDPSDRIPPTPNNIQRLRLRRPTLEIYPPAARGSCSPRRDCACVLHGDKQRSHGHHRCCNLQRHSGAGCAVF